MFGLNRVIRILRGPLRLLCQMRRFNEQFLAAIREDKDPVVSGHMGRAVMEMTLGVYASHFTGQLARFPLLDRKHPLFSF